MKPLLRLSLAAVVIGLSVGLLWSHIKETFSPRTEELLPQPTLELPEGGVQTDAFSVQLFRTAVARQEGAGSVTVVPFSTKILLGSMAETFRFQGEAAKQINPTQQGIDDSDSATPLQLSISFTADYDLKRKPLAAELEVLPFRTNYPLALSVFNGHFADFFRTPYAGNQNFVSADTRLIGQELSLFTPRWLRDFREADTKKEDFDNANGALPQVDMLRCCAPFRMAEAADGSWKAIALFFAPAPRSTGKTPIAFIGILPQQPVREFVEQLTPQQLSDIRTALVKAPYADCKVTLPSLNITPAPASLTPLLQEMDITAPFDIRAAAFKAMTEETVAMNDVVQAMQLSLKASPGKEPANPLLEADGPEMNFTRPFLWLIGDLTTPTAPYFMGVVENL